MTDSKAMSAADRAKKAEALFRSGYNCAQSVTGAYADMFGADEALIMRAAEGFGGGTGRMRLTCGAVSGAALLCGLRLSKGAPGDIETRAEIYGTVRKIAAEFKERHGSIICGELLKGLIPESETERPGERTAEYYKKRPCVECIKDAAEIAWKYLI